MAHAQQLKFVEITSNFFGLSNRPGTRVIEIGSYIVNETIRDFFKGADYIGVDLMPGPGVDIISNGEGINVPIESFDVAISCECFEHNPHWIKSFVTMHQITKMDGIVIVSCASRGRIEHGTKRTCPDSSPGTQSIQWDYYKNIIIGDFRKLKLDEMFSSHIFAYNNLSKDLYFVGLKSDTFLNSKFNLSDLKNQISSINSFIPKSKTPQILRILWNITNIPLYITSFLPDRLYQNFALKYWKLMQSLRAHVINLIKLKID